jgi:hypothetical protein
MARACVPVGSAHDPGAGGWRGHHRFLSTACNGEAVNIHLSFTPVISLVAGILILVMPKLLNFIVAIYLILVGAIGLFGTGAFHLT